MGRIAEWWRRLLEESRPRNPDIYFGKGGLRGGSPADDFRPEEEVKRACSRCGESDHIACIGTPPVPEDRPLEFKTNQHIPGDVINRQVEAYQRSMENPEEPKSDDK